ARQWLGSRPRVPVDRGGQDAELLPEAPHAERMEALPVDRLERGLDDLRLRQRPLTGPAGAVGSDPSPVHGGHSRQPRSLAGLPTTISSNFASLTPASRSASRNPPRMNPKPFPP